MSKTPAPRAPLTVETDLELTIDGARAAVHSTGDRLFVEFPTLSAATTALQSLPREGTTEFAALLAETDLTLEVRSRGRTILVMSPDAPPGPLSRWLGAAPGQVRAAGLLAAVGREFAAALAVGRNLFN